MLFSSLVSNSTVNAALTAVSSSIVIFPFETVAAIPFKDWEALPVSFETRYTSPVLPFAIMYSWPSSSSSA